MLTIGIYGDEDPKGLLRSHDHAIAVIKDGCVKFHMELERVTGVKHDGRLNHYIDQILDENNLKHEKYHYVLVNSFMSQSFSSLNNSIKINTEDNTLTVNEMYRELDDGNFIVAHEIAHIASCLPFYGNFKANSLMVHFDGGASDSCVSAWFYDGDKIINLHHSWDKTLKCAINNFNANPLTARILDVDVTEHLSMPGKLMGLASFGNYDSDLHNHLLENNWFCDAPDDIFLDFQTGANIAICMQKEFENQIVKFISNQKNKVNADYLYYSGGAALNIHANVIIEKKCGFKSVFIPPAPNDAGLALGGAAFIQWINGCEFQIHQAFLNNYESNNIDRSLLKKSDLNLVTSAEQAAKLIEHGEIIAVFSGNGEMGPRALGHRSLIARADNITIRKQLSETMKQREWYRPVAPMLLEHIAQRSLCYWNSNSHLPQFMLGAWTVKHDWKEYFEGCIHADGTVRAQTIKKDTHLHLFELLSILENKYQILAIINTSFNSRGIPIVHNIQQAIEHAKIMNIKYFWFMDEIRK